MKNGRFYKELEHIQNMTGDFLENVGYLALRVHKDLVAASVEDYKTRTHENVMNRLTYWFVDDGEDDDSTTIKIR